jgi:site-specific DNA recombinase
MILGPGARAIILTRVSTDAQSDNTSHETQDEYCTRFCESRGWNVVRRFHETESGAAYASRLDTQAALALIERGGAQLLVLYDMSRYGRDVEFQHRMLKRICAVGAQLQFSTLQLEYDDGWLTPESEIMFNTLGGNASFERSVIRRRLRNGMLKQAREGKQPARARSPLGYRIVQNNDVIRGTYPAGSEGTYAIIESEAAIVRAIYDTYEQTKSIRRTCTEVQVLGMLPRQSPAWFPHTIRKILRSPVYRGEAHYARYRHRTNESRSDQAHQKNSRTIHPGSDMITIPVPPLITQTQWDRVQILLSEGNKSRSGRGSRKYLLPGIAFCPMCGARLYSRVQSEVARGCIEKKYSLQCRHGIARTAALKTKCSRSTYSGEMFESLTMAALKHVLLQPQVVVAAHEQYRLEQAKKLTAGPTVDVNALHREIAQWAKREAAAVEAAIDARVAGLDHASYERARIEMQTKREAVERRLKVIQEQPKLATRIPNLAGPGVVKVLSCLEDPTIPVELRFSMLEQVVRAVYPVISTSEISFRRLGGVKVVLRTSETGPVISVTAMVVNINSNKRPQKMEFSVQVKSYPVDRSDTYQEEITDQKAVSKL